MSDASPDDISNPRSGIKFRGPVAVAAVGAMACGVCCALPFAFSAVALAGAGGALSWLDEAQGLLTIAGYGAVIAAWAWVIARSLRSKRRPARSTLLVLALITIALTAGAVLRLQGQV